MKAYVFLLGGVAAAALGAVMALGGGCASTSCEDTLTCPGMQGDGSTDGPVSDHQLTDVHKDGAGNGDSGDGGVVTDGSKDGDVSIPCSDASPPSMNGCVTNATGLFVSSTLGSDAGTTTGTMTDPFATITEALAKATAGTNIYVCEGSYKDQITVSIGVNIYGGFTCTGGVWSYSGAMGSRANIQGTTPAFALQIDAGSAVVDIEDLVFKGMAAGAGTGQSSIGVLVNASTSVAIHRSGLEAGNGGSGVDGGAFTSNWSSATLTGNNASGTTEGLPVTITCSLPPSASSSGGAGGALAGMGQSGSSNPPISGTAPNDGVGGAGATSSLLCKNGDPGAPGLGGGAGGAGSGGAFALDVWTGGVGSAGSAGYPGQGGGGGGGAITASGGGGGGAGGCGGGAGVGAGGGGGSFALVIVSSTVTLDTCVLKTGTGGTGGTGGAGQDGQGGGGPGMSPGCNGGAGGLGGGGGGGGGGAGGPSVGVAEIGTVTLSIDGMNITTNLASLPAPSSFVGGGAGTGGTGGAPGTGGGAAMGTMGMPGAADAVMQF
jgi:hypothetical protein